MPDQILPCPFCGGEAEIRTNFVHQFAVCKECAAVSDYKNCESEAISAWNRRASPPAAESDDAIYANLLAVIADIRHKTGVGHKPMLDELADVLAEKIKAGSPPAAVPDAWNKLLLAAKILYQNAEGCAANHHARDFKAFGLPGWLADCKRGIENAEASLVGISAAPAAVPDGLMDALKSAEKALRPFFNAVFNDNGDMTVHGAYRYHEAVAGYWAYKRVRDAISAAPTAPTSSTVDLDDVAARLWKAEAEDSGTPASVIAGRTREAFDDQSEELKNRWRKFARAAAPTEGSDE